MRTLSVCMIIKNEAPQLERAITSVLPAADELIIVDTGSTDNSKQIAAKYTNKLFDFKWIDDFGAAYNFAANKATKQFCLRWDADFSIDQASLRKLQLAKKRNFNYANIISLNWIAEQTGSNRTLTLRDLIHKRTEFSFEFPVHARITPKKGIKIIAHAYPSIFIRHHKQAATSQKRYSQTEKILDNALRENPNNTYLLEHKLDGDLFSGRVESAIQTAEQLLAHKLHRLDRVHVVTKYVQAQLLRNDQNAAWRVIEQNSDIKKHPSIELIVADLTALRDETKALQLYAAFLGHNYSQFDIGPGYSEYRYIVHPKQMIVALS